MDFRPIEVESISDYVQKQDDDVKLQCNVFRPGEEYFLIGYQGNWKELNGIYTQELTIDSQERLDYAFKHFREYGDIFPSHLKSEKCKKLRSAWIVSLNETSELIDV